MNAVTQPAWLAEAAHAFLERYEAASASLPGDAAVRQQGAAAFRRAGLPGMRDEEWRYTSIRPLAETRFAAPDAPGLDGPDPDAPDTAAALALLPDIAVPRAVFVNGAFAASLSRLPDAATVRTGAPAYAGLSRLEDRNLAALNTMLAQDGADVNVAEDTDGGVLVLASLGQGGTGAAVSFHPRHAVRLAPRARLTLIEVSRGGGAYLHNPVLEVALAQGATLTHIRVQDEARDAFHASVVYASVADGATYDSFALAQGGRLARMEVHAHLAGPRAAAHLNAAQMVAGGQHIDFTTVVRHEAPGCASRQTVKNVLIGRARAVFQGKIEVARAAQKTDGYQMNQTLLLSPDAEIDSKPQLEIFADDVKCSHGATVGELDAEQLFYLRSRGIPYGAARAMLVRAFLAEALDPVTEVQARALLEAAVDGWWEREAA